MSDDEILELFDKIIGYADNQPLIMNHLQVLRHAVEKCLSLASEAASNYATLEAQNGNLHIINDKLRFEMEQLRADLDAAKKKPQITAEAIKPERSERLRGLDGLV